MLWIALTILFAFWKHMDIIMSDPVGKMQCSISDLAQNCEQCMFALESRVMESWEDLNKMTSQEERHL